MKVCEAEKLLLADGLLTPSTVRKYLDQSNPRVDGLSVRDGLVSADKTIRERAELAVKDLAATS